MEPRPAATIVLARPAPAGFELLLLRRPDTSRFAAGAYVFPGGVIDAADADEALVPVLPGLAGPERAALVCALRELFEETGLLPADGPRPAGSDPGAPLPARERLRERLLADEVTFTDVVTELGATFRALRAVYISRWITPIAFTRRYDTRFFLAEAAADATPELTREHTAFLWSSAAGALEGFRAGGLPMLFPTWKTIETLSRYESVEDVIAAHRGLEIHPVTPRLDIRGDRVRPLVPGDPGYERAEGADG